MMATMQYGVKSKLAAICCSVPIFLLLAKFAFAKCLGEGLGDMLTFEGPRIIEQLKNIESTGKGYQLKGIQLCDGSTILRNWIFKQSLHFTSCRQHIYIFQEKKAIRAVVWIEPDGQPVAIPPCTNGKRCDEMDEPAHGISGDVYTWKEVQPGDGVVLLLYPTEKWIQQLTTQSCGEISR